MKTVDDPALRGAGRYGFMRQSPIFQVLRKGKQRLRAIAIRIRAEILRRIATRPRLAALYYGVVDDSLSREAAGVAAGRVRYQHDSKAPNETYFLLRRNIHRLEKGLIMRPRRKVFAVDYLPETISVYERLLKSGPGGATAEGLWARDVLRQYFDAVDTSHPPIAAQYRRFQALEHCDAPEAGAHRVPYARDLDKPAPVDFDQFMALSMRRRSVRWYLDKPVPRELIDRALQAAAQAPSACNRQPFVYRIFDDPAQVKKIMAIPLGTRGFGDQVPVVAVLVGRLRAYPFARDRHAIYVDGGLSAMSFMYALETLGLSSCPINWADCQPQESMMASALGLEPDERVIMLIGLGWPDPQGMVPYSAKRELAQLRQFC